MSASRSFHQSASEPWGSISIRTTGPAPASWACTARWPDKVVLPEPPFCDARASTRMEIPQSADIHTGNRSEEHTSELQSLMRISYAVFCLKKKKQSITQITSRCKQLPQHQP